MATETVDVAVVGSGYGGSIPACRLAQAGMRVVVLERGPRRSLATFRQSDEPKYINGIVDLVVSAGNLAFRTGKMVGGASIPMDGAHFRMPRHSFRAKDEAGRPYWPAALSRESLDPYYAKAEEMLLVRQFVWDEIPKAGGLFAKMLDLAGASCDRARLNYTDCLGCGFCAQGCTFGKKMTLLHNYIPGAERAGAVFRAEAEVDHLEPAGSDGYKVVYRQGGQGQELLARRVIVAGGGIHTPALLLRSAKYLTKLSAHLGRHFSNNGEHAFVGILPPEFDDLSSYLCYKGQDNGAVMSFHWFESDGFTLHPGAGLEPSLFAASFAADKHPVLPRRAWGMEYKRFVEQVFPHRVIAFSALGLAPGFHTISVDAKGTPQLVEGDRSANDAYLDRLERIVLEVGQKTGVALLPATPRKFAGTTSAHLLAACRMAESAADGVLDADGQVFGHERLYVCDASAVPCAIGVNPALTISAIAERTAARIIAKG
ncbi:MAG: GMC family oxidoreductase [Deltaproteobacteria bacterium]|nr:GMC family oxidoreductase [Deltaproteobacteria bacterium]